jgi:hypothetical protein
MIKWFYGEMVKWFYGENGFDSLPLFKKTVTRAV